ncbi:diguanylate cyclase [Roseovarius sp. LXJ103]|uniref:diguanylate cyclase n=1 Tax=Roseovarius carneus TaxID=2853164 RepID=UPI000D6133D3|nr:diguanylate cyclase [Roseovarius carneus]MBZ8117180.1 diguanylate cyclase [Roseovarius carneus]PWE36981.1 diguanylate cyclase response regulator [Pelagicola sp. LXJ1103]
MSGNILIVDTVATNRIVLKVKLSAAYFDVAQARSGAEALEAIRRDRPDMIVANAKLSDMGAEDFITRVRARPDLAVIPIVLILPEECRAGRVACLLAGADDVIAQPINERMLLARMRGLLRQHHTLQDMRMSAGPDCASGFSEAQGGFQTPGEIALLSVDKGDATSLRARLQATCRDKITVMETARALTNSGAVRGPDVVVLLSMPGADDTVTKLMAELRAAPHMRHSRIVAVVQDDAGPLAATLLDMGVDDVMTGALHLPELTLRLQNQMRRKKAIEGLRNRLHDGLRAAMIDPLTGLYNRRFALPFLTELARGQQGQGRAFAVMVADLDHFKRVNDDHGHAAGDKVLVHVADLLRRGLRENDLIARIGGEEFLIVMPDTSAQTARDTASRLCRDVAAGTVHVPGGAPELGVTVSIGVAMGFSDKHGQTDAEALIEQADRALYGSKACGRNTVTVCARPAA